MMTARVNFGPSINSLDQGDARASFLKAFARPAGIMMFSVVGLLSVAPALAQGAMSNDAMKGGGKVLKITLKNLTTGQPFSPSYFESRSRSGAPLFKLGDKASEALVAVAEGGNIGNFSVAAAKNEDSTRGEGALAIHTLPGQVRTFFIHVDKDHPLIDGVWMLGNTNDGFSGVSGIDAYNLAAPMTISPRGYDAGSEKNNEKKGYLGALGAGNMRDPENGVIAYHAGIRGDADAPKSWAWDVSKPVAEVTITPLQMGF